MSARYAAMTNAAFIQRLFDDAFTTLDFGELAAHLDEGVVLEVTPHDGAEVVATSGRAAIVDYFTALGDIVSFWRVRCYGEGERIVALGAERFKVPGSGVTLGGEFAFLLHVCGERITRFLIIEQLTHSSGLEPSALERV
jgi:ketosteroid isomerase-like protein